MAKTAMQTCKASLIDNAAYEFLHRQGDGAPNKLYSQRVCRSLPLI